MKQINLRAILNHRLALLATYVLSAALFVCANTNSCCMVHQPNVPDGIENYSKIL